MTDIFPFLPFQSHFLRAWDVAQVVERLPSVDEALAQFPEPEKPGVVVQDRNPNTPKTKGQKFKLIWL